MAQVVDIMMSKSFGTEIGVTCVELAEFKRVIIVYPNLCDPYQTVEYHRFQNQAEDLSRETLALGKERPSCGVVGAEEADYFLARQRHPGIIS